MSGWWTYRPEDLLLFSSRAYWRLFERANAEIWPVQIIILLLAAAALIWIIRPRPGSDRLIAAFMAAAWILAGSWFIAEFYAPINWAVSYAVPLFAVEAALLFFFGVIRREIHFVVRRDLSTTIGVSLFVYALALHPVVALIAGRSIWAAEIVGIAPDPTAIGTLGILAMASRGTLAWLALLPPILWCLFSAATLLAMGAWEGRIPLAAAVLAAVAAIVRRRN